MSAFNTLFPLLRRGGGAVPSSWTCRACSQSLGRTTPQARIPFSGDIRGGRTYATESTNGTASGSGSGPKSRRRRRLAIAAGGVVAAGGVAIAVSDDAKHAYTATKRSYRVLETLFLNVREYVRGTTSPPTRPRAFHYIANRYNVQLPIYSQTRRRPGVRREAQRMPPTMRQTNPPRAGEERLDLHKAGPAFEQYELSAAK